MPFDSVRFHAPVVYWPRRTGLYMWSSSTRDDVRRDFERAAGYGFRHLACALTWPEFQPEPDRISAHAMRALEMLLEEAADYGIDLWITLFPVLLGRLLWLPSWILDPLQLGQRSIYTGNGFSRQEARSLFADTLVVQAQARQVREVIGEFGAHPAVSSWQLGDGMETVVPPQSSDEYDEWLQTLLSAVPQGRDAIRLWTGITAHAAIRTASIDPRVVTAQSVCSVLTTGWTPVWAHGAGALWPAFLAAYVRALSGGLTAVHSSCSALEQADELHQLTEIGAAGCVGPPLYDPSAELLRTSVYRQGGITSGDALFTVEGTPRETADLWLSYQLDPPSVGTLPVEFPQPDPDRRTYSPEDVAFECFEAFVR
jgi:hypothetical protein